MALKKLKRVAIPEDTALQHGQMIAIEGIGNFVGKLFGGKTKSLTKEQAEAMADKKGPDFGQDIKAYVAKTVMNQGWVKNSLKMGEKNAVPCRVAFINGKPEANPEKLITCLKGMMQAADHVLKVLQQNTKLRQQLGQAILADESDTEKADKLFDANKERLSSNLAQYYMQHGGKNVQYAVGQNPADKAPGFPVNISKEDKSVEFERYYASHSAPGGCAIPAPTHENAAQYGKYILELVAMIAQARAATKENTVPFWEMYESDFENLQYGDEISFMIFGGHEKNAVDPMLAVEAIASEILTTMLTAI